LLLRLAGNSIEALGSLDVPRNLGTPGQRNSRFVANAGPAIFQVRHSPAVPAADQPVVVTAQFHDPDGLGPLRLRYRLDPGQSFSELLMNDSGRAAMPWPAMASTVRLFRDKPEAR